MSADDTVFSGLVDLAAEHLGGRVLWASDDFFAEKEKRIASLWYRRLPLMNRFIRGYSSRTNVSALKRSMVRVTFPFKLPGGFSRKAIAFSISIVYLM